MTRRDRVTIGLLGFFLLLAVTIELYFLVFHADLPARAQSELFARGLRFYSAADRSFYDPVTPLALTLEGVNVFFMQPLCVLLIYAIARGRRYRWPLQIGISAYLAVSVLFYYTVSVLSGYAGMAEHTTSAYLLLYGANLPWLVGYGWLGYDAARVVVRALADAPALTASAPVAAAVDQLAPLPDEARLAVVRVAGSSEAPSDAGGRAG
jgi:hypothetical protein